MRGGKHVIAVFRSHRVGRADHRFDERMSRASHDLGAGHGRLSCSSFWPGWIITAPRVTTLVNFLSIDGRLISCAARVRCRRHFVVRLYSFLTTTVPSRTSRTVAANNIVTSGDGVGSYGVRTSVAGASTASCCWSAICSARLAGVETAPIVRLVAAQPIRMMNSTSPQGHRNFEISPIWLR